MNIPLEDMERIARAAVDKAWEYLPEDTDVVDIVPVVEEGAIALRMVRPRTDEPARTIVVRGTNGSLQAAGASPRKVVTRDQSGNLVGSASLQDSRVANQAVQEALAEWLDDANLDDISRVFQSDPVGSEFARKLGF